jgi:nucleoprotein TPR
MDVKSRLSNSEVMPLVHEKQRLQTELDSITTHSQWLEGELARRSQEYAELKKTHSTQMVKLQNDIDQLTQEKEAESARVMSLERVERQLVAKVEQQAKQSMQQQTEQVNAALAAEQELAAERRLVELQKEQLDRFEKKHDDVIREMEAMKQKSNEAQEDSRRERSERHEREAKKLEQELEEQKIKYESQVQELTQQLEEAKRRLGEAEDRFLAQPETTGTTNPLAITVGTGENDDEPISLTDLSTRLQEAQSQLTAEQNRRKKAEIRFKRVMADIEARAPTLMRQRQVYDLAMERQEELQRRLNDALEEVTVYRAESRDLRAELSRVQKRNQGLEQETTGLARQVQALLISRAGGEVSSGDIPTSIEEIQSQNQRLLGEIRRLTAREKELEESLESDTLRSKLETRERELTTLREDRRQQETLVAGIVQQRDLYRALLAKHDSKLLGTEEEEVTAIEMTKRQSERAKALQQTNDALENDLATTRGELDRCHRDKEITSERLKRFEMLNTELTKSNDNLQMQLSTAKSDAARCKAECSYYSERASRTEESLQLARKEIAHVSSTKNKLERINADMQNAVTKANAETSRVENELRQVRKISQVCHVLPE